MPDEKCLDSLNLKLVKVPLCEKGHFLPYTRNLVTSYDFHEKFHREQSRLGAHAPNRFAQRLRAKWPHPIDTWGSGDPT
jgi:hypothetical protein